MNNPKYNAQYVFELLKKSYSTSALTQEEKNYLKTIKALFEEEEWDRLEVDAVFEVTAEERNAKASSVQPPDLTRDGEGASPVAGEVSAAASGSKQPPAAGSKQSTRAASPAAGSKQPLAAGPGTPISGNENMSSQNHSEAPKLDLNQIVRTAQRRRLQKKLITFIPAITGVAAILILALFLIRNQMPERIDPELQCTDVPSQQPMPLLDFSINIAGDASAQSLHFIKPGEIGKVYEQGSLKVMRHATGLFEILGSDIHRDSLPDSSFLLFLTDRYQQAEILLPNGTHVRLNAGSSLAYTSLASVAHAEGMPEEIKIRGEAWVQIPDTVLHPLRLTTIHADVQAASGSQFTLLSTPTASVITLLKGQARLESYSNQHHYLMDKKGLTVKILSVRDLNGQPRTQWSHKIDPKVPEIPAWTQPIREFKNVPLREFVTEMARWHGIKIEKIECIPSNLKVNVAICYRSDINAMLQVIQQSGVYIQRKNEMFSFCKPENVLSRDLDAVSYVF